MNNKIILPLLMMLGFSSAEADKAAIDFEIDARNIPHLTPQEWHAIYFSKLRTKEEKDYIVKMIKQAIGNCQDALQVINSLNTPLDIKDISLLANAVARGTSFNFSLDRKFHYLAPVVYGFVRIVTDVSESEFPEYLSFDNPDAFSSVIPALSKLVEKVITRSNECLQLTQ